MDVAAVRERLGRVGTWIAPFTLLTSPVDDQRRQFARIEEAGYGSLWSGEPPGGATAAGREAFAQHGSMLAATHGIVVGTGIANTSVRQAAAMHTGAATLAEWYPGRFILGLGGQTGRAPLAGMRGYLDQMDATAAGALSDVAYPRVLAALGPKMLELAATRADGAHPFLQPVEHTARAREILGPDRLLIPHQAVVVETDGERARGILRTALYSRSSDQRSPYTDNYRRLGFSDDDLSGTRSDRLIDAILAWGDVEAVAKRVRAQLEAGADHVLVHPFAPTLAAAVDQLILLAPALLA